MNFKKVISISRPRFWLYEFGTYMIGILTWLYIINQWPWSLVDSAPNWLLYIWHHRQIISLRWLYFLIPANIYIYGINDIYDYETDKNNPKKQWYEDLVTPAEQKSLRKWILISNLPFLLLMTQLNIYTNIVFLLFLFFAWQYSAYPVRAKIKPIVDCLFSAGHYVTTAVFAFVMLVWVEDLNRIYIWAGVLWCMAMHIYSAIPDIKADSEAGMYTTAMLFGARGSIFLVGGLYILAGVMSYSWLWVVSPIISLIYIYMMMRSYIHIEDNTKLLDIYKYFPWINAIVGMIIFWSVLLKVI